MDPNGELCDTGKTRVNWKRFVGQFVEAVCYRQGIVCGRVLSSCFLLHSGASHVPGFLCLHEIHSYKTFFHVALTPAGAHSLGP